MGKQSDNNNLKTTLVPNFGPGGLGGGFVPGPAVLTDEEMEGPKDRGLIGSRVDTFLGADE